MSRLLDELEQMAEEFVCQVGDMLDEDDLLGSLTRDRLVTLLLTFGLLAVLWDRKTYEEDNDADA